MSVTPTPSDNDEDFDIYGDLLDLNLKEKSPEKKCDTETLKQQLLALQSENETLRNSNRSLSDQNKNLSCNISILYKTASEEIKRKDKTIEDLQRELDSYLFRRNGRKPPDRGSKNMHSSTNHMAEDSVNQQQDCVPRTHYSTINSGTSTKHENKNCTENSSDSRECPLGVSKSLTSLNRMENTAPQLKTERIIKEVPKKRKVIEYSDFEEKRPIAEPMCDSKVVKPSILDRLGYQESAPLPAEKTDKTLSSLANEETKSIKERTVCGSNEKKEDNQQTPSTESTNLLKEPPLEKEKISDQLESSKPSFSDVSVKPEPSGNFQIPTEPLQEPITKEDAVRKPLAAPLLQQEKVLPENCVSFQPPLPQGDPLPPPPPPSSTPPPTPVKCLQQGESTCNKISEAPDPNGTVSTGSLTSQVDPANCNKGDSNTSIKSEPHKECDKTNKPRWSDENLHMQCPFKPRRRAKSVVVVEDAVDHKTMKSAEPPKVETSSRSSKSLDKFKRTPLKKSDIQENRLTSEFRSHQTQRSVHSNRHLSLKSNAHLPERRSPSELLNGRSGRIARISHQDKVRARFHDRRSRSLSPQKKRFREEEHRTKIVQRATTRESNRRIVREEYSGKNDKILDDRKSKSLKKQNLTPKEEVPKMKQKMTDLFGDSSSEPEENISKTSNGNLKFCPLSASTLEAIPQKEETLSHASHLKSSMNTANSKPPTPMNNIHLEADVIVVKRRPRSSIKLGPSEDASRSTQILTVQTSRQVSLNSFKSIFKNGNGASDMKSVKPDQVEEQEKKETMVRHPHKTPLYFREQGVKRSTSDDEDLVGESEESVTNADSDDTYNPKMSLKKSIKRRPTKRKK